MSDFGPDLGITVTGHGTASAAPDVFVADLAAEVAAATPGEAFAEASAALRLIAEAAAAAQVAADDLRSGEMSLWTDQDREGRPQGYRASLRLEVRVRDLARAGDTLARLVEAGGAAARLQGTRFEHSDSLGLATAAQEAAFAEAVSRAMRYAGLAGRPLGPVVAVREFAAGGSPRPSIARMAMADSAGPPVAAGSLAVSASVTVSWAWG